MPTNADPWSVAVVGAGPWGTYAVERLTALVRAGSFPRPFQLLVLEASGNFGCGRVHHDQQTESSQLNRVASQIAFAADETVSNILLPSRLRPTMAEWASEKFTQTGNDRYQLESTDIPSRALHGEALRDAFNTYVTALRDVPRVDVRLIAARADRLTPRVDGRVDLGAGPLLWTVNHVLLTTGHGAVDLAPYPLREYLDGTVLPSRPQRPPLASATTPPGQNRHASSPSAAAGTSPPPAPAMTRHWTLPAVDTRHSNSQDATSPRTTSTPCWHGAPFSISNGLWSH
ncbi:MAG: hypothetical protein CSA74_01775 [Rhodobacterales bacterium]|nr:MAG: hypothetical protein CSA74_01775 [Rhodobacterales bacterium]